MCGPTSLRRNDLILLSDSNINGRMREIQQNADVIILSLVKVHKIRWFDRIYEVITLKEIKENIKDYRRWINAMKKVRISIEWNYGYTASLYCLVKNTNK
jgi:hypothetical protein